MKITYLLAAAIARVIHSRRQRRLRSEAAKMSLEHRYLAFKYNERNQMTSSNLVGLH